MFQSSRLNSMNKKQTLQKRLLSLKNYRFTEKMAVKDIYAMIGKTKGDIISKIDGIIKQQSREKEMLKCQE